VCWQTSGAAANGGEVRWKAICPPHPNDSLLSPPDARISHIVFQSPAHSDLSGSKSGTEREAVMCYRTIPSQQNQDRRRQQENADTERKARDRHEEPRERVDRSREETREKVEVE